MVSRKIAWCQRHPPLFSWTVHCTYLSSPVSLQLTFAVLRWYWWRQHANSPPSHPPPLSASGWSPLMVTTFAVFLPNYPPKISVLDINYSQIRIVHSLLTSFSYWTHFFRRAVSLKYPPTRPTTTRGPLFLPEGDTNPRLPFREMMIYLPQFDTTPLNDKQPLKLLLL